MNNPDLNDCMRNTDRNKKIVARIYLPLILQMTC